MWLYTYCTYGASVSEQYAYLQATAGRRVRAVRRRGRAAGFLIPYRRGPDALHVWQLQLLG